MLRALQGSAGPLRWPSLRRVDALADDDLQLALWCCYQLHYRSFDGVDDRLEWDPGLLEARHVLEQRVLDGLFDAVGAPSAVHPKQVVPGLQALAGAEGPSLSTYLADSGTYEQMGEFLVHRSAYQLKEADPHTWAIPRLTGATKAAYVAIQYDEYGEGRAGAMHAELFGDTMRAFGLDPSFGAYVDLLPGTTLATDNLVTMLGLHRRWRNACVGHLALFEMTSVTPMARYSRALRRFGVGADARRFYDVHVLADAVHERVAQEEMVGALVAEDPASAGDILFGARCVALVEGRFTEYLLDAWADERSSLLEPITMPLAV